MAEREVREPLADGQQRRRSLQPRPPGHLGGDAVGDDREMGQREHPEHGTGGQTDLPPHPGHEETRALPEQRQRPRGGDRARQPAPHPIRTPKRNAHPPPPPPPPPTHHSLAHPPPPPPNQTP